MRGGQIHHRDTEAQRHRGQREQKQLLISPSRSVSCPDMILRRKGGIANTGATPGHFPLYIHRGAMYDPGMKLAKEHVAASAAPLVLSILEQGESYGYATIRRVKGRSGGQIQWTDRMLSP